MRIKTAMGTFGWRRNAGSPCAACLYGAASSIVISGELRRFLPVSHMRLTQIQANIGGQTLEQSPCIARLGIHTFRCVLCPPRNSRQFLGARHTALTLGTDGMGRHISAGHR